MFIVVITYIIFGIILVSNGPLSKNLAKEINITQPDNSKTFKIRKALFSLLLILIGILLYPIFYYSYFFQNGNKLSDRPTKIYEEGKLYFHNTSGKGNIICKDCNNLEMMTSFMHGFDTKVNKRTSERGFQCQECGKLCTICGPEGEKTILKNCDCGGTLERELPLFCPTCKSTNVMYNLKYIT